MRRQDIGSHDIGPCLLFTLRHQVGFTLLQEIDCNITEPELIENNGTIMIGNQIQINIHSFVGDWVTYIQPVNCA